MEHQIKDLETGNQNLEAKLQEKDQLMLALKKELENEKRKDAKSSLATKEKNGNVGALGTSVQQIDIQIWPSSCDCVLPTLQETIKRKENRERQVTDCHLESIGRKSEAAVASNQLKEQNIRPKEIRDFRSQGRGRLQPDSLVARDSETAAPSEDKNNSGFQHLEPRTNKLEETVPADKHMHCRGRAEGTVVRDQVETNAKKVKASERRLRKMHVGSVETEELQAHAGESNRQLAVLEKMLQDQATKRQERPHSGSFDEGYGSGADQNFSPVRSDTVSEQDGEYERLKIRLRASDRLRRDPDEKSSEVEMLQNKREHLIDEKPTPAGRLRHAHHDLMSIKRALHSARKEIESLMVQMRARGKMHCKEMVDMSVVAQDSKQTVAPVIASGTDFGSTTQEDSLSSQLSNGIKQKIRERPVGQTTHGKTHNARLEHLDCVSCRPRGGSNANYTCTVLLLLPLQTLPQGGPTALPQAPVPKPTMTPAFSDS
ncbi:hypothetical protein N1851_018884 [Merluccius polli]|uniref:Uncharacterized protein n=1 Tax=Merluccius polli TaxID=89951 RepID=A0AA47MMY3_MERPO|nr:hypothetical protein N1851_018884 [Merluccius polli]